MAPAPSPQDVASINRETPRSTFEAFITAQRGGLLGLEYECFSLRLRRQHGLSQHAYREFREDLMSREPHMTWALHHSVLDEVVSLGPRRTLLRGRVDLPALVNLWADDYEFEVEMVLEDRVEVLGGHETLAALGGPPQEFDLVRSGLLRVSENGQNLWVQIPLERPLEPANLGSITTIALNSRWRIDRLKLGSVLLE